jgi:inhibitor of KinA
MNSFPRFIPAGDSALLVQLGEQIDLSLNRRLHALAQRLNGIAGLGEAVPGYAALLLHYDPLLLDDAQVLALVQRELALVEEASIPAARRVEIPVRYGGMDGPDLEFVAAHNGLSVEEVVHLHSQVDYVVYFLGFSPGFPYLGGLDSAIATPRLDSPRPRIPAGSVGIAGGQTGLYPQETPGGWRIIGRTGLRLFDPTQQQPALLAPGDVVRFVVQGGG